MVGFSYNEVSRRYVDDQPEFFVPDAWRKRAENKKQGSSDEVVPFNFTEHVVTLNLETGEEKKGEVQDLQMNARSPISFEDVTLDYRTLLSYCELYYNWLIDIGVAPEQARMVLPQSLFTEYYCTGSLAAWARAYKLRVDPHAQKEIRDLAKMWNNVISNIKELKYSWEALTQ